MRRFLHRVFRLLTSVMVLAARFFLDLDDASARMYVYYWTCRFVEGGAVDDRVLEWLDGHSKKSEKKTKKEDAR